MLSAGAFNALLKTLEEPPEHVKFILATTEPQKLPTTILSRCQRFDYKKISNQDIIKRLKIICEESNINITEDALNLIAVLSEGAMRDAISILERCSQEEVEKIEISIVKNLVGLPSTGIISKLVNAIVENDEIVALNTVDEIIEEGKDLYNFVWEIIKYIKDVLLFKATEKAELYSQEEVEQIKEISKKVSREKLLNIIYLFSDLERDIKWSEQKTIMLQTAIIKACAKYENNGIEDLQRMVKELEEKIASGNFSVNNSESEIKTTLKETNIVKQEKEVSNNVKINSEGTTVSSWRSVLDYLKNNKKMLLFTALANTKAKQVGDMILEVYFLNGLTPFNQTTLDNIDNKNALNQAIVKVLGKEMHIKYFDAKGASIESFKESKEESKNNNSISTGFNPMGDLGIDINIFE